MLKRNCAQKYGNDLVKFGSDFKGCLRARIMVSHTGGEGLVNLKETQTY